jgi:hypothetical protein
MSTYREIHGKAVKSLSTDPSVDTDEGQIWYNTTSDTFKSIVNVAAWVSAAPMINANSYQASSGTQTAGITSGGYQLPSSLNVSEDYNGSGWTANANINTARGECGGAGPQTAALIVGGDRATPSLAYANTETFDGSSWSEQPDMNNARFGLGAAGEGTTTASLAFGGNPSPLLGKTEEYDGSSWSNQNDLNTPGSGMQGSGAGTQTAGLAFGRTPNGNSGATELYDGTNWATSGAMNTSRDNAAGGGPQTAAYVAGGGGPSAVTATETFDGTTWTTSSATLGSAAKGLSGTGNSSSGLAMGNYPAATTTSEFNSSTTAYTSAAWASGGTLNTARQRTGGFGNAQTSAVTAAGASAPPASAMDKTEEYNGTSWTEVNAVNTARYNMTAFGTEAAGVLAGVGTPSVTYGGTTEEYNGSTWANVTAYSAPGANYRSSCGPQTAGLLAGGVAPAPAEMTNAVEEYDGTNWTNGTNLPQYQSYSNMAGTQTAAINGGGNAGPAAPGPVSANAISLEYNGSAWTAGPNANLYSDRLNSFNGGSGTQASALFVGGDGTAGVRYDGTSFSTDASYPAARGETSAAGLAPSTAACIFAGSPVPSVGGTTLEYSGETSAANIEDFTTS